MGVYYKYRDTSLSFSERADDLIPRLTTKEKTMLLIASSEGVERLGVEHMYIGNEALHGIIRPGRFTVFPQAIGLGCMFDPDLIEQITDAMTDESRARHHRGNEGVFDNTPFWGGRYTDLRCFWSPDLNLCRDPRWGRTGETYGEDPYLAGKNGIAFVRGLQGHDPKYIKAIATPKHFTANNEEHNRFSCNAVMSEKTLREYHLEPFRMAVVEGKAVSVMGAYNAINGVPCHINKHILTDILKKEWGFEGFVVTDCGALERLVDSHKITDDKEAATAEAMNAGVDAECGEYIYQYIEKAVEDGLVSEERLNDAVKRMLIARFRLGMFDPQENVPWSNLPLSVIGCEKHVKLAYQTACESLVLLKNSNNILPLSKDAKILVAGNNAHICQFGDYSGKPVHEPVTAAAGIQAVSGSFADVVWKEEKKREYAPVPCNFAGKYYQNTAFLGTPAERTDSEINFRWNDMAPDSFVSNTGFSIEWHGTLKANETGSYKFRITSGFETKCEKPVFMIDGVSYGKDADVIWEKDSEHEITLKYIRSSGEPVFVFEWITPEEDEGPEFEAEIAAASGRDIVIAVIGLGNAFEHEGHDKDDLDIPAKQVRFIEKMRELGKKIVTVIMNGSPVSIKRVHELSDAVIEAWYPGEQGGNAIADVIFGNVCPSGKLNATFPYSTDDLPPFDDYNNENGRTYMYMTKEPLYPFGFGLSYTDFKYSDLRTEGRTVYVTLENTGKTEGTEVTQLYIDSAGLEHQPMFRLRKFCRTALKSGEKKELSFELSDEDFILYEEDGTPKINSGTYTVYAGGCLPTDRSVQLGAKMPLSGKIIL